MKMRDGNRNDGFLNPIFCALCVLSRLGKHIAVINLAAKERRERKDEDGEWETG
jgi:hypothetical protein